MSAMRRRVRRTAEGLALLALLAAVAAGLAHAGTALPRFAPTTTQATISRPRFLAVHDMNRDGIDDLVISGAFSMAVLIGDSTGALTRLGVQYDGSSSGALRVGRINADLYPDVVVTAPNAVEVLPGAYTGGLYTGTQFGTTSTPSDLALADFNGVNAIDLVVASEAEGRVELLVGIAGGRFAWYSSIPAGSLPTAVEAGDLDGDGRQDIVVSNGGSNTVSVILGNGNGTFQPKRDFATGNNPGSCALGDLDADGRLDVVVTNHLAGTVSVFHGVGDGTLAPGVEYPAGVEPTFVEMADLNGDGHVDLVVVDAASDAILLLMAQEGGGYVTSHPIPVGDRPLACAIVDLDRDGRPDIVCTNYDANSFSVLRQVEPGAPTLTALDPVATSSVFGEDFSLRATVSPTPDSGTVTFRAGGTVLATVPVAGGVASTVVHLLAHGTYTLTAAFDGDVAHAPSVSDPAAHRVALAPTVATLQAAASPTMHGAPATFAATVAAVTPLEVRPEGRVQFRLDDTDLGAPVTLTAGSATSAATTTITIGTHTLRAVYLPADTLRFAACTSPPLLHTVESEDPRIVRVTDVPGDEGGLVHIAWHCLLDQPGYSTVKSYRVWRRLPPGWSAATGAVAGGREVRALRLARPDSSGMETFWEAVASLPAARLVSYGYTAATTQDSMAGSNPYTAFVIQAVTAAEEFRASPPDSGYSVDNLAPPAPVPFAAVYGADLTRLEWHPGTTADLRQYRLHRGASADFTPAPANLVTITADTTFADPPGAACYKLAAVDVHGNAGRFAVVSPAAPTAALATTLRCEYRDDTVRLRWYLSVDGPATLTVYRRTLASDWAPVAAVKPDAAGEAGFTDTEPAAGMRYGYRLGVRPAEGAESLSDVAWIDAPSSASDLSVRVPNPVAGGDLTVSFAAPAGHAVRVELLDVSGRLVATRDVTGGLGRRSVSLARAGVLAPGLYLVRVGLEQPVVMRVAVLR